jgi:tetratricopeptide (TPR) repeat protein
LARDGGEWWAALSAKDPSCEAVLEGDATSGPFALPQLHDSQKERQDAYFQALRTFAHLLGVVPGSHLPNLDDAHFSRPLYIQMAALMSLRGERPRSAEALQRAVVNHEKRYWGKILSIAPGEAGDYERQSSLLMTLATLANGISTERSIEKAWTAAGQKKSDLHRVFSALSSLYPDRQGLQGLKPDLIGEALVAQSLLTSNGSTILDVIIRSEKKVRLAGLTVIARILRDRADLNSMIEDALTRRFSSCIDEVIAVCVETPSPLPDIVKNAYQKLSNPQKLQTAGVLEQRLHYEILELTGLDVEVSKTIVEKELKRSKRHSEEDTLRYGSSIMNLSIAYVRDGKSDEALATARQSVSVYKTFLHPKSDNFKSGLASSYVNFANRLQEQGHVEEAVIAALQAVELYRALNKQAAERFSHDLAVALICYGHCLIKLGRADEASILGKEALDLYGEIFPHTPVELRMQIAAATNNYASYLQAEGREDEALAASEKALHIFQELATDGTTRFQSLYAMSLHHYSGHIASQGKFLEALNISEQALNIINVMAELRPDRFRADLATVLRSYGDFLSGLGRYEQSLSVVKESLDICQEIAETRFSRFSTDLMNSLLSHSRGLANQGYVDEALVSCRKALVLLDSFIESNPSLHSPSRELCRINIAILEWLVSGQADLDRIKAEGSRIKDIHTQRAIEFYKLCSLVWVESDYDLISTALNQFALMNRTQRRGAENEMFLLVALAAHVYGLGFISESWREFSELYRSRRGGNVPAWIVQAALIHGFSL